MTGHFALHHGRILTVSEDMGSNLEQQTDCQQSLVVVMWMIMTAVRMQKMPSVTKLVWIVEAVVVPLNWDVLLPEVLEYVSCIFLFSMWLAWCLYQVLIVLL